jgi:hypothetical protein
MDDGERLMPSVVCVCVCMHVLRDMYVCVVYM